MSESKTPNCKQWDETPTAHDWVTSYTGKMRTCRWCRREERTIEGQLRADLAEAVAERDRLQSSLKLTQPHER